jgi:hypothetical protein
MALKTIVIDKKKKGPTRSEDEEEVEMVLCC